MDSSEVVPIEVEAVVDVHGDEGDHHDAEIIETEIVDVHDDGGVVDVDVHAADEHIVDAPIIEQRRSTVAHSNVGVRGSVASSIAINHFSGSDDDGEHASDGVNSFGIDQPVLTPSINGITTAVSVDLDHPEEAMDADSTPVAPRVRTPPALLKQMSSFAAWQVNKEKYGVCFGAAKTPKFCYFMILVCCVMFIVEMVVADGKFESLEINPTFGPSVRALLYLGAKRADLIVNNQEYYRLIAPMVLHGGVVHLVLNMIGLYQIGCPIEREYGTLKFIYVYLSSGFVGVLISCIFRPYTVGVGASGAIFGIFGAAWADLVQNWSLYRSQGMGPKVFIQLFLATAVNLGLGVLPYLDNFSHIGGFVNGVFAGLAVFIQDRFNRFGEKKQKKMYQSCLQVVSVVITPLRSMPAAASGVGW